MLSLRCLEIWLDGTLLFDIVVVVAALLSSSLALRCVLCGAGLCCALSFAVLSCAVGCRVNYPKSALQR